MRWVLVVLGCKIVTGGCLQLPNASAIRLLQDQLCSDNKHWTINKQHIHKINVAK